MLSEWIEWIYISNVRRAYGNTLIVYLGIFQWTGCISMDVSSPINTINTIHITTQMNIFMSAAPKYECSLNGMRDKFQRRKYINLIAFSDQAIGKQWHITILKIC